MLDHGVNLPTLLLSAVYRRWIRPTAMSTHNPSRSHRRGRLALALFVFVFTPSACNSASGPPVPVGVTAVSGDEQYAITGSPAANPLVVLVVGSDATPFAGAGVKWSVAGGGGSVSDSTSNSDATGHAQMTYTAGQSPGVATVVATVADVWTTTFTVYIEAPVNSRARLP